MVRENENLAYFPLLFNILGQKITNMRRLRSLTEDLIKEFISVVGIRVELLECLAILKAVPVEVFHLTRKIYFAIIDLLISLFTRKNPFRFFRTFCISSYYKNQLRCFSISLFLLYRYLFIFDLHVIGQRL